MAKRISQVFLFIAALAILYGCSSSALPTVEGAIGDWVWLDANGDGIQDDEELGVENVEVFLYSTDDNLIESTSTDRLGQYSFVDPGSGEYYLQFNPPEGFAFTLLQVDDDDQVDSDAKQSDGETEFFEFTAGGTLHSMDAGLVVFIATPTFTAIPMTPTPLNTSTPVATSTPSSFMPENDVHELDAEFTLVKGDCGGPSTFTETIVATIDGNSLTLRNTFMGITSSGTINPDGSFMAMHPDYESYEGRFDADWSGDAVYSFTDENGCTTEHTVTFTPRG